MKYLDPKADLTFKRVFGEHPDLVISFLNAMLPFDKDEEIKEIKYLPLNWFPIIHYVRTVLWTCVVLMPVADSFLSRCR